MTDRTMRFLAGAAVLLVAFGGWVSSAAAQAPAAVAPQDLIPLLDGHNDPTADRINLVFAGYQMGDEQALRDAAVDLLGWDGNVVFHDIEGNPTDDPTAPFRQLGLFGIEPWRSSKAKFNLWYTPLQPVSELDWQIESHVPPSLQAVPDAVLITLGGTQGPDTDIAGSEANAGKASMAFESPATLERTEDPFGNVFVAMTNPPGEVRHILAHEMGHALFKLEDEYGYRYGATEDSPDDTLYPNCAYSRADAEAWWGDLVGQVDPMVDVWAAELAEAGAPLSDNGLAVLREQVTVGFVEPGCTTTPGFRPTPDSLMNGHRTFPPILGSANRRWAEQVLALWSGQPLPPGSPVEPTRPPAPAEGIPVPTRIDTGLGGTA